MHLLSPITPSWVPPVCICSALEMTGIKDLWDMVYCHRTKMTETGELCAKRRGQSLDWMWSLIEDGLRDQFYRNPNVADLLPQIIRDVENGDRTPTAAAFRLLHSLGGR